MVPLWTNVASLQCISSTEYGFTVFQIPTGLPHGTCNCVLVGDLRKAGPSSRSFLRYFLRGLMYLFERLLVREQCGNVVFEDSFYGLFRWQEKFAQLRLELFVPLLLGRFELL